MGWVENVVRPPSPLKYKAVWWNYFSEPPSRGGSKATFPGTPEGYAEAHAWWTRMERENAERFQRGEPLRSRRFGDYAESVIETLPLGSEQTRIGYRSQVRQLIKHFGRTTPVAGIGTADVRAMLGDVSRRLSVGTAKARYNVLNIIMGCAMTDSPPLRRNNPCREIGTPRAGEHEAFWYTPDDISRIVWHMPDRYKAPVLLAYYGGLRISEVCGVRVRALDPMHGWVRVNRARINTTTVQEYTKGKRNRTVALGQHVLPALRRHTEEYAPAVADESVFTSSIGTPLTPHTLRTNFKKACEKAELPFREMRFHDLRHTAATNLADAGAQAPVIADVLGHSSLNQAQRYIQRVSDERQAEWANRVHKPLPPAASE